MNVTIEDIERTEQETDMTFTQAIDDTPQGDKVVSLSEMNDPEHFYYFRFENDNGDTTDLTPNQVTGNETIN